MAKVKSSQSKVKTILFSLIIAYLPLLTIGLVTFTSAPGYFLSINMPFIVASTIIAALLLLFSFKIQRSQIISNRLYLGVAILLILIFEMVLWAMLTHWWDFLLWDMATRKVCSAPDSMLKYVPSNQLHLLCDPYK